MGNLDARLTALERQAAGQAGDYSRLYELAAAGRWLALSDGEIERLIAVSGGLSEADANRLPALTDEELEALIAGADAEIAAMTGVTDGQP